MSAQPGDQHWFISLKGKRYGPYSFAALSEAVAKGVIDGNTSVWRLGWVKWHPARRVPGLIEEMPPPEPLDQGEDGEIDQGVGASEDTDRPPRQDQDAGAEAPRRRGRPPPGDEQVTAEDERKLRRHPQDDVVELPRRRKSRTAEDEQVAAEGQRNRSVEDGVVELPRRWKARASEDEQVAAEGQRNRPVEDVGEAPRRRNSQAAEDEDVPAERPLRARPLLPEDDDIAADAPPITERPANVAGRRADDAAVPEVELRDRLAPTPSRRQTRGVAKSAAVGALSVVLVAGAVAGLFYSGTILMVEPRRSNPAVEAVPPPAQPAQTAQPAAPDPASPTPGVPSNLAADRGLPSVVAALPAVVTLQRSDPATFARFSKRFADIAANAPEDTFPSLARTVLRKTLKSQLATSTSDTLREITDVYLGYMQALQTLSPESCVALSDESKGASLTVNLAQQLPVLFAREMAVLERAAGNTSGTIVAPPTGDQARQYLDKVYGVLLKQPVQSDLLGRPTLAQSEFAPYCALVIAFYKTVLTLPPDDRANLLRYLYAAAIDPDDDVK
jgi:hypothetical protein